MNLRAELARLRAIVEKPRRERERMAELDRRAWDLLPQVLRDRVLAFQEVKP